MTLLIPILLLITSASLSAELRNKTVEEAAQALFTKAEGYLVQGRRGDALDTLESLVKRHRMVPIASEAQFKIAVLLENNHKWVNAFDAYQDFFSWFPNSPKFNKAIENQIRIAWRIQRELDEERRDGKSPSQRNKNLPDNETPSDMFRLILENGKYSGLAPLVRYHLAVAYEKEERTVSAKRMHSTIAADYPTHPMADDAAFQIGYIDYKGVLKGDKRRAFGAEMALKDFLLRYPNSEKAPEALHCLDEMRNVEAAYLAATASYYEKANKPKSALVYLKRLMQEFAEFVKDRELMEEKIKSLEALIPLSGESDSDIAELP
jgi:outer membrane protein assembly factor BamD (BamD/ComL family)